MGRLFVLHRYLSCLVAPAMIFFAVSGAWQAYRLQQNRKDGSYTAPAALTALSKVHMAEDLTPAVRPWFRLGQLALASAFVATAAAGIAMALRTGRRAWPAWVCLGAGTLLTVLATLATRGG